MNNEIMINLICFMISILAAIASSILIPALSAWLKSKTENEKIQSMISDITTTVQTSVNKYEQTTVSSLKDAGEWNRQSQHDVLMSVVNEVVSNLLGTTKDSFVDNGIDISDVVERYVESYIQSKKNK